MSSNVLRALCALLLAVSSGCAAHQNYDALEIARTTLLAGFGPAQGGAGGGGSGMQNPATDDLDMSEHEITGVAGMTMTDDIDLANNNLNNVNDLDVNTITGDVVINSDVLLNADGSAEFNSGAYSRLVVVGAEGNVALGDDDLRGQVYTLSGVTALTDATLSDAPTGSHATWVVDDTDGWRIYAAAGDTIRISGTVTAAGGGVTATALGSTVTLVKTGSNAWIATDAKGTWSTVSAP